MAAHTPSRRAFLGAAAASALVPIAARAGAAPAADDWARFTAAMAMLHPAFAKVTRHAQRAGMRLEWLFAMTNTTAQALLFKLPNGQLKTFYPEGEDRRAA